VGDFGEWGDMCMCFWSFLGCLFVLIFKKI
jgi:hypothetical protein